MDGAYWLIRLFLAAVVLVLVKPITPNTDWVRSAINGMGVFIVVTNVLILVEFTQLVFAIEPDIAEEPDDHATL